MSSVKKKRGLFASRAHSFKENILEALKHGQVHSSSQQRKTRPDKNAIILAKKTSSTDNLTVTGHLGTAKSTDCLIKDVQFALKYFQDVVSKQTYEMLPGCATVVLETVLAIKAFASNLSDDCMDTEMCSALQNAFKAVSVLTSWADSVIIDSGHFDSQADYVESVVEPVRRAVIVAVNCISMRVGNKALARGNSLPDITNDDCDDYSFDLSQSSGSIEDIDKPPLFPKHSRQQDAPPLPPKHFKPKLDRFEDLLAHSLSLHSMEWAPSQTRNYRTLNLGRTPENSLHNKSLPSPAGLDTTLNDNSFQYSFDSPTSLSKESLTNVSFDEPDQCHSSKQHQFATRSWSSRERSNTSSPSFETLSFASHLSDLERPPAIPKKSRSICVTSSSLGVSSSHGPAISHVTPTRKLSQYDNVPDTESSQLRQQMFEFNVRTDNIHALQVAKANSLSSSSPKNVIKSPERSLSSSKTTFNRVNQIQDLKDVPPPLPPKKRNIMSYMEMFGRPIFPSGDEMFEGLVHSQDLLHNVWQHNFHEYSDYTPTGLFNFPFASSHPQEFRGLHPYINVKPGDPLTGLAPALPPKRSTISSQSRPGSFRSTGSSSESERRIPIMIETDQQTLRHSQLSDSGSSSSSEVPRIAEITRLPRLSVAIPIQRICNKSEEDFQPKEDSILDRLDVSDYLVYGEQSTTNNNNNNKNVSVSLELRAGDIDALVVLATQTIKNDFLYQEAFLTTYRTFISAENLVKKLVYRFKVFNTDKILSGQRAGSMIRISRNAFSLLVRVVDTLADGDFANKPLLEMLTSFITSLVECGELGLARALRSQLIMKYEERRARLLPDLDMTSLNTVTKGTLLNFKSSEVAEQMTLLGKHSLCWLGLMREASVLYSETF